MKDVDLVAAYCKHLAHVRGQRPRSVQARRRQITRWTTFLAEHGSTLATATRHDALAWMPEGAGPSARKTYLSALSGFHGWLVEEGITATNPIANIPRPMQHRQLPRAISDDDAARVWDRCPWEARPAIGLAMMCGLRCQEISGARWEDVEFGKLTTLIVPTATAKGGHERRVVVPDELVAVLRAHQQATGWLARGPKGQGGNPELMSMWIRHILHEKCVVEASAHQLRHWFAGALLRRGANLKIVQDALGHASLATTGLYLKMTIADQAAYAVDLTPRRVAS